MAKLLITGATGLLGSCIVRESLNEHEIFGISKESIPPAARWQHRRLDLTDATPTLLFLTNVHPQIIIHCAALTDVEQCERNESRAWAINVEATKVLASWADEHAAKFVLISTDSVFDGTSSNYRESDHPAPVNVYARTKLAAEELVRSHCPGALVIRTNFFGWSHGRRTGLAEWMLARLARGESFGGFTDIRFSPLFTRELAQIILELIHRDARGIFHVGTRDSCSKYEFAMELARLFQLEASILHRVSVNESPFRARRPKDTSLATEKISSFLGRGMPSVSEQIEVMRRTMPLSDHVGTERLARSVAAM